MTNRLRSATWPAVVRGCTVLVPVGSVEQHGPHLPLDTDTVIATAVAEAVADRLGEIEQELRDVYVAPALCYGASGEHQSFAGTSSIGTDALVLMLVELVRSMRTWASQVVFVNGHGGNARALERAVTQLIHEGHAVVWRACRRETLDCHAGYTETSLMLHLNPDCVNLRTVEAGNTRPLEELMPAMIHGGVEAVSRNGVLGDPTGASAAEGRRVLAAMVDEIVDAVRVPERLGGEPS